MSATAPAAPKTNRIGLAKADYEGSKSTLCLGCGTCYPTCNLDAIRMRSRERRVYTPETTFDRIVAMAIERGKLAETIFADPEQLSYRALGRVIQALEKSPPVRAAAAIRPLRSAFLQGVVGTAGRFAGGI